METWLTLLSTNLVFSIPLGIVFIIGILETLLAFFGAGFSEAFENIDFTPNSDASTISELFSFLNKGQIPTLMIILTSLTAFGLSGLIVQNLALTFIETQLSLFLAIPAAIVLSLPFIRYTSLILSKILPKDETTAISTNLLSGRLAQITIGTATINNPAEAKVTDMYGETHYIMIKPAIDNLVFKQGEKVLLIQKEDKNKNVFLAQPDPNSIVKPN